MLIKLFLYLFFLSFASSLHAQAVNETDAEVSALPSYCQATLRGPKEAQELWNRRLGRNIRHHCWGLVYMNRALTEIDSRKRGLHLSRAVGEFNYELRAWPPDFPLYKEAETMRNLATELGKSN